VKRQIWKFPIALGENFVKVPTGAELLPGSMQVQRSTICIWALVNPEEKKTETRAIHVMGTGNDIPYPDAHRSYLGTIQIGDFVWHGFEMLM
jgi:hypothetical protein